MWWEPQTRGALGGKDPQVEANRPPGAQPQGPRARQPVGSGAAAEGSSPSSGWQTTCEEPVHRLQSKRKGCRRGEASPFCAQCGPESQGPA